jgi:hypothetical protein
MSHDDGWAARLIVVGTALLSSVIAVATAMPTATIDDPEFRRHVSATCDSSECLSTRQFVNTHEAAWMRREQTILIVDVGEQAVRSSVMADARIPFMNSGEFCIPFGYEVDEALRDAGMRHEQPVLLVSPALSTSILAALLLQERGYTRILVIAD